MVKLQSYAVKLIYFSNYGGKTMTRELFNDCSQEELAELNRVKNEFDLKGKIVSVIRKKEGRINSTLQVVTQEEGVGFENHIFQTINVGIFKDYVGLMSNINLVTEHIRSKGKTTIFVHPVKILTCDSPFVYYDKGTGKHWRVYNYIDSTVKNSVENAEDMYLLGYEIGNFSSLLADFDVTKLVETIPGFHDTRKRYSNFVATMVNDISSFNEVRSTTCWKEIQFVLNRGEKAALIVDALANGHIPYRVSHNDTKLNNLLLNRITKKAIGFIDLDTVGPGAVHYDFGDACRYACNTASEEAVTTENVSFNVKYFEACTRGLLESMRSTITEEEVELLVDSVWVLTYELILRFLADHIDGNHYFGVPYDGKNLERARVQIALLKDIETKYDELRKSVSDIWTDVKK